MFVSKYIHVGIHIRSNSINIVIYAWVLLTFLQLTKSRNLLPILLKVKVK